MKSIENSRFHWLVFILLILGLVTSCDSRSEFEDQVEVGDQRQIERDLDSIRKDGKLRALTTYSPTSYFLYKGEPMGYEYEMLKRFADYLDVKLEMVITDNIDSLFNELNSGKVDIVAHGLAITADRKEDVAFTQYLYLVNQVLVQRKPMNWRQMGWGQVQSSMINDPIELIGDTVSVRANTSYLKRLKNLSREIGGVIHIDTLPGSLSTDEIIKKVVDGEVKMTVADNNIASLNAAYYPILNVEVPVSFSQRIAWAVRPTSRDLLEAANTWITQMKKTTDYYVIYNKYFKNKHRYRRRVKSKFFSINNNRISQYDALIQKYAGKIGWDWRLLASLIYQESGFKPKSTSWAQAEGLMQLMPATAQELGVTNPSDPEQSLQGGTRYLEQMWENFNEVPDSLERIKFTMAAFNAGLGHVKDAQRLASKYGLDSLIWENNVEKMILNLSYPKYYNDPVVYYGYVRGIEPYTYVNQIFERYGHYKKFIDKNAMLASRRME